VKESIKEKLDLLQGYIEEMGGMIDFNWCGDLLYPYYVHFNDNNHIYRAGSLLAFWGLLLDWEDGSGFPFYTGVEDYNCHRFDKYLQGFLKYSSDLKEKYPNIYFVIIESLKVLDKREVFENIFPNINEDLFNTVRNKLFYDDIQKPVAVYKNALREAGMYDGVRYFNRI
jgi:hypothetical protein